MTAPQFAEGGVARLVPRSIIALVVAGLMIGGAVVIRGQIDDTGSGAAGPARPRGSDDQPIQIACITELQSVCDTLDAAVTIEAGGTTEQRISDADRAEDLDIDAWVTYAPLAEIVRDDRQRAGREDVLEDAVALARTPLVAVALNDRAAALREHCPGDVSWACIGGVAGQPWTQAGGQASWGTVRPAHGEPVMSASGLLVLGQAVGSFLASSEASPDLKVDDISRIDWETSDDFPGWFQQLERSVPDDAFATGTDPFKRWLQTRGSQYGVVATTEAAAVPALAGAAADVRDRATVIYPSPVATADVVLVPVRGARGTDDQQDALRAALTDAGYRVDDASVPSGGPDLPPTDGLPSAGALDALRALWLRVVK